MHCVFVQHGHKGGEGEHASWWGGRADTAYLRLPNAPPRPRRSQPWSLTLWIVRNVLLSVSPEEVLRAFFWAAKEAWIESMLVSRTRPPVIMQFRRRCTCDGAEEGGQCGRRAGMGDLGGRWSERLLLRSER